MAVAAEQNQDNYSDRKLEKDFHVSLQNQIVEYDHGKVIKFLKISLNLQFWNYVAQNGTLPRVSGLMQEFLSNGTIGI